jgi:hypothetical protein
LRDFILFEHFLITIGMADLSQQTQQSEEKAVEEKFIVPYHENPQFTGRDAFLRTLRQNLCARMANKFNHRVALYGMGGIGKTQCALKYIYMNRSNYSRIYWISAVDQSSLLSGYQKIAKSARLPGHLTSKPVEIAETVLSWLKREQNWLLVIDNLDDVTVVDGFLPENGPEQHTLITTRNPHTKGIPAEPLEVPLLTAGESVELLIKLSNMEVLPDSVESKQVEEIVKELEYLPLAIEQAAAYVREVTEDFSRYSEEYQNNHRELYQWVPTGNRQYSYSVATTWSMSFTILQSEHPQAAKLLQLFAYLNPDGNNLVRFE